MNLLLQKKKYIILTFIIIFLNIQSAEVKKNSNDGKQLLKLDFGNKKIISLEKKLALKLSFLKTSLKIKDTDLIYIPEAEVYYEIFKEVIKFLVDAESFFIGNNLSLSQLIDLLNALDFFDYKEALNDELFYKLFAEMLISKSIKMLNRDNIYDEEELIDMFEKELFEVLENIKNYALKDEIKCNCLKSILKNGHTFKACNYDIFLNNDSFYNINYIHEISGLTILMHAVLWQDIFVIQFLLNLKVDKSIKSKRGKTALDIARDQGYENIIQLLENN